MKMPRLAPTLAPGVVGNQSLVRDLNLRAVYEYIALEGPSSRAEVARHLGLSAASVGRIVDLLIASNLLQEGERVASGVGRPQTMLHTTPDATTVAGVSIRSQSLRAYLADLDGNVLASTRVDRSDDAPEVLAQQVAQVLNDLAQRVTPVRPIAAATIGLSAVWNEGERRVYAAPNLAILEGTDARALFERALDGVLLEPAIAIDNDVNLAALGEFATGSATGVNDFFYVSLGSGVGGASVVNGVVQHGASGFAGEIGHLPTYAEGRIDRLENFLARTPLLRFTRQQGIDLPEGPAALEALSATLDEHPHVADAITRLLGQALVSVVTTLDPTLVVLGGSVGRHVGPWTDHVQRHIAHFVPEAPPITATALGREASLIGAVALSQTLARGVLIRRLGDA